MPAETVGLPENLPELSSDKELRAVFNTSLGTIECRLFARECPSTVRNFVGLARGKIKWTQPDGEVSEAPLYDNTIFHRIIPDFMVQGGCPRGDGTGGPGYRFEDEFNKELRHDKPGILSMANSGPNTNGSQFFITHVATPWLDDRHTVFGEVVEGMDLVHKMGQLPTGRNDRPQQDIVLRSITIREQSAPSPG